MLKISKSVSIIQKNGYPILVSTMYLEIKGGWALVREWLLIVCTFEEIEKGRDKSLKYLLYTSSVIDL